MALFKINRGPEDRLPETKKDGWAYYCTTTGRFYIDALNEETNEIERKCISSEYADKLRYVKNGETIEIDIEKIVEFGNPNNQALTKNSTAMCGGVGSEGDKNIAGQMGYLICGVDTTNNTLIIEDPDDGNYPNPQKPVRYSVRPGTAWSWVETGAATINSIQTGITSKPYEAIIDSNTGKYFILTINETLNINNDNFKDKTADEVRDARIACRLWQKDCPECGNYQIGYGAMAIGKRTKALGDSSFACGSKSIASGAYAFANSGEASGTSSVSMAGSKQAAGNVSLSAGSGSYANGDYSMVLGVENTANKPYSILMGDYLTSSSSNNKSFIALGTGNDPETSEFFTIGIGSKTNKLNGLTLSRQGKLTTHGPYETKSYVDCNKVVTKNIECSDTLKVSKIEPPESKLTIAGDINCNEIKLKSYTYGNEGETGWYKFATYNVTNNYARSEALFYITSRQPGTKVMALVGINVEDSPNGFQEIRVAQLSGDDITTTSKIEARYDEDNSILDFYIFKPERYQIYHITRLNYGSNPQMNVINPVNENVVYSETTGTLKASLSKTYCTEKDLYNYNKKPTVIYWNEPTLSFEFASRDNNVIRTGELESISFYYSIINNDDYMAEVSFDSGSIPTLVDYNVPPTPSEKSVINWVGVDCVLTSYVNDAGQEVPISVFQPSANTHYEIVFYFNGTQIIGLVNGFVPASGNVVVE